MVRMMARFRLGYDTPTRTCEGMVQLGLKVLRAERNRCRGIGSYHLVHHTTKHDNHQISMVQPANCLLRLLQKVIDRVMGRLKF